MSQDDADSTPTPDPFLPPVFDETFIAGAEAHEPSAAERFTQAVVEQQRRSDEVRRARRERRRPTRWGALFVLLVVSLIAAAIVTDRLADGRLVSSADRYELDGVAGRYPPKPDDESDHPLGQPPEAPDSDAYRFLQTDPMTRRPVRYNPCRPIHIVVNGALQVPDSDAILRRSLDRVSAATGLVFVVDGSTDERPSARRSPQQARYGEQWAPVLVAWTDAEVAPELKGDVAGVGGSQAMRRGDTPMTYVTGSVLLDAPEMIELLTMKNGQSHAEAIVVHELSHLVGLGHVDDRSQLMYAENTGQVDLGDGDRAGLAKLGGGPCVPGL